jgi:hypothetical protein
LQTLSVSSEEVGFAAAWQIGRLRTRVRGCGRQSKETRFLISSAEKERLDAQGLLDSKRGYWAIEATLHYRLDDTLVRCGKSSVAILAVRTASSRGEREGDREDIYANRDS